MGYDKHQATHEFTRWSESYDRSILQVLLFGPSHRAIIARIKAEHGDRADPDPRRRLRHGGLRRQDPRGVAQRPGGRDRPGGRGMLAKGADRWKRHADGVFPVQADSERLPFARGAFDVVTCANSFHHYPHQDRAVAEMRRVLRPGGKLLLVDGYRDNPWGWLIYDVCVAGVEGAVHHASAARIRDLCGQGGFASTTQKVHRGLAPFLLSEAVVGAGAERRSRPALRRNVGPRGLVGRIPPRPDSGLRKRSGPACHARLRRSGRIR